MPNLNAIRLTFGKYRGELVSEVALSDPRYLRWLLGERRPAWQLAYSC